MGMVMLTGGLLCLLVGQVISICSPADYTLYVEKPDCDFCVAINTTICMGFCCSWDSNVGKQYAVHQKCTYQAVQYHTAMLPGCPLHVDPLYSYPVALKCHCRDCKTDGNECIHRASPDGDKCSKPLRHIYPYPGQSNYIQSH
ncbi:hypothetical protein AAFF_G00409790 [Aldrovandia affinis]|uniref:Thyrotropin subunit beta n=1 Tax=Aldrovandia affinis TaxID=143900 RepID=A0AAD7WJX3_9TELE|nr:hypothetical protein AAFF_G00409790 [Aldrovandia affinis]